MYQLDLTPGLVKRLLNVVDAGLVSGVGEPEPGKMCVEAAVCYVLDLPHRDDPPCVSIAVRRAKIRLNDAHWSSPQARAKGMRRAAIAQLGSDRIDPRKFVEIIVRETVRVILPIALRAAATLSGDEKHRVALETAAKLCEAEPTRSSTANAANAANAAYTAAYTAYTAYTAAAYTAAVNAAAIAAVHAAYTAYTAANAANAAVNAVNTANTAYAANAAIDAIDALDANPAETYDAVLSTMAEIIVQALIECGSEGCKYLHLCDEANHG